MGFEQDHLSRMVLKRSVLKDPGLEETEIRFLDRAEQSRGPSLLVDLVVEMDVVRVICLAHHLQASSSLVVALCEVIMIGGPCHPLLQHLLFPLLTGVYVLTVSRSSMEMDGPSDTQRMRQHASSASTA